MSILISAPIRTGKTLYVIKCIFDELNKGRQVYTNIVGIKIDGVISVSSSIDKPFDWRDLPNGSVLVWDEAHEHPSFSEKDLLKNYELQNKWQFDEIIEKVKLDQILKKKKKKSRIETVEKAYKKALESIDSNPSNVFSIVRSFESHSLLNEAVIAYEKAMTLNPNYNFNLQTN